MATASPKGAEWETLGRPDGCAACHLAEQAPAESAALSIEGLPDSIVAGRRYEWTIVLRDPSLLVGGFLLGVLNGAAAAEAQAAGGDPTAATRPIQAGTLAAGDDRSETSGALARSTRAGALPPAPGEIRWPLVWTAPAAPASGVRIELWGNAGNDDLSPLGDRIYHRSWMIPAAP